MTKERRLAIEMWKDIRSRIIMLGQRMRGGDIVEYKFMFCRKHDLKWSGDCWFCHYIHNCVKCPLGGCSSDGYYGHVSDYWDKDVRVEACNNIIKALGGEA